MTFVGEQGPFHDTIGTKSRYEYSGWTYLTKKFCPSEPDKCPGCEEWECERCREVLVIDEDIDREFCWGCDDPVPQDWERLHVEALESTTQIGMVW